MIKIKDWMSSPLITVDPEDSVLKATKKMVKYDIGDVVVIDKNKKCIGILTERDLIKRVIVKQKDPSKIKVKNIMTKNVKTVDINTSILKVSRMMRKGKFRRVPVTENGKVVGIITARDLVHMISV